MKPKEISFSEIESRIFLIQGEKVLLDSDLAELYQIPTKRLKEQVKRNAKRFPRDFMFVLSNQDFTILRSQFATSRLAWGGLRIPPMVFTEQGVAMLSSVLNSDRAIDVNIAIMRTFVKLREVLNSNQEFKEKFNALEAKYDVKFRLVFDAIKELMSTSAVPRKRIIGLEPKEEVAT